MRARDGWSEDGLVRYQRKYLSDGKTITYLRNEAVSGTITEQAGEALYRSLA